jgi:hypothetical protein
MSPRRRTLTSNEGATEVRQAPAAALRDCRGRLTARAQPTYLDLETVLLSVLMYGPNGQVCFKSANGIPMGMPRRLERIATPIFRKLVEYRPPQGNDHG